MPDHQPPGGVTGDQAQVTKAERWAAMTWAQRLKRVFGVVIETCSVCGGALRLISGIEDPVVIEKILAHLDAKAAAGQAFRRPAPRKLRRRLCSPWTERGRHSPRTSRRFIRPILLYSWFDESQFESHRKLGHYIREAVFQAPLIEATQRQEMAGDSGSILPWLFEILRERRDEPA